MKEAKRIVVTGAAGTTLMMSIRASNASSFFMSPCRFVID